MLSYVKFIRYIKMQVPFYGVCVALIFRGIYTMIRSGIRRIDNRRITLLGFESDENWFRPKFHSRASWITRSADN